jgi:hypothetical protein
MISAFGAYSILSRLASSVSVRLRVAVVVGFLSAPAALAQYYHGNTGLGHMDIRSLSPGHLLRPNASVALMPGGDGSFTLDLTFDWGNVWNFDEDYFVIDAEWLLLSARGTMRITDRLGIGFVLPFSIRSGGVMDTVIEDFHTAVGLDNDDRDRLPKNGVHIRVMNNDGEIFDLNSGHTGLADIPLLVSYRLTRGGDLCPALALQTGVTLPVGSKDQLEGMGQPVVSVNLLGTKRILRSPCLVFASAGASYCRTDQIAGIDLIELEGTAVLGIEWQLSRRESLLVQYLYSTPVAEDYHDFSEPVHEFNVGLKRVLSDGTVLEASFTENAFILNNSIDVGLHVGFSKCF